MEYAARLPDHKNTLGISEKSFQSMMKTASLTLYNPDRKVNTIGMLRRKAKAYYLSIKYQRRKEVKKRE